MLRELYVCAFSVKGTNHFTCKQRRGGQQQVHMAEPVFQYISDTERASLCISLHFLLPRCDLLLRKLALTSPPDQAPQVVLSPLETQPTV
jgi:hypothetical protein